ncbi:MAG: YvcK family protein [Planctomycetes bacterium]|nr:YvcK family protein [Planctomycetota bacterium]
MTERRRLILRELNRKQFSPLDLIDKEAVVEKVVALTVHARHVRTLDAPFYQDLLQSFAAFATSQVRTVVFGGGSGLSSILGGDSRSGAWAEHPFTGLKSLFEDLTVGVCTTDDGGSTGRLLRRLELIAVGDFRKVCLSMVRADRLAHLYGVKVPAQAGLVRMLQTVINHRFAVDAPDAAAAAVLVDPVTRLAPEALEICPGSLVRYFRRLATVFRSDPRLAGVPLAGNCLGNLYLVASIYRHASRRRAHPGHAAVLAGLQSFADRIGAPGERLFPATTAPGQLRFLYGSGVIVSGQNKAVVSRRGFPVERVSADYLQARPRVDPRLLAAIRRADLILFAPGSVFSSQIPILQIETIARAIRANRRAVKVLAANFWVQEGETDVTRRGPGARYNVSDMIEAYHRNVPGGADGLFTQILVADLQQLPGHVLRNYALEGKLPIFLDRPRVKAMGFEPIEAPVFSREMLERYHILHHDAERFALAVKTLLYLKELLQKPPRPRLSAAARLEVRPARRRVSPASYMAAVDRRLAALDLRPRDLEERLREIAWKNRDILPEHLGQFVGVRVIAPDRWKRSTEWDQVLGYFDPADRFLKIHRQLLLGDPRRLQEDILIGVGESLLGSYFREKAVAPLVLDGTPAGKVYRLRLAPERARHCFLSDAELREWLELANLKPSADDPDLYRLVIHGDAGFMPPGLRFGLLYAWYLDNRFGGLTDYEMSLIRWQVSDLIPHQSRRLLTQRKRIAFFRRAVFRQEDGEVEALLAAARQDARLRAGEREQG